jgi:hypothetical protein
MTDGIVAVEMGAQGAPSAAQSPAATSQTEQQPVRYGNVAENDFVEAIKQFGLTGIDDIKNVQTLRAERDRLMAEAAKPRYASPIIEKLNTLAESGKDTHALMQVLRIQSVDLSSLAPLEILKQQMLLQDSQMDSATADAFLARKFPDLGENASESERRLRDYDIRTAAEVAKSELQKLQADAGLQRQVDPVAEQQRLLVQRGWSELFDKSGQTIQIRDKYEDGEFQLDYKPNLAPEAWGQIKEAVTQYAVQNGLKFDESGMRAMETYRNNLVMLAAPDQYRRAIIKDVEASVRANVVRQFHNPSGYTEPQGQDGAPQTQKGIVRGGGLM